MLLLSLVLLCSLNYFQNSTHVKWSFVTLYCHWGCEPVCLITLFTKMWTFHILLHYQNMWKFIFTQQPGKNRISPLPSVAVPQSVYCEQLSEHHLQPLKRLTRALQRSLWVLGIIYICHVICPEQVIPPPSPWPRCSGASIRMPWGRRLSSFYPLGYQP